MFLNLFLLSSDECDSYYDKNLLSFILSCLYRSLSLSSMIQIFSYICLSKISIFYNWWAFRLSSSFSPTPAPSSISSLPKPNRLPLKLTPKWSAPRPNLSGWSPLKGRSSKVIVEPGSSPKTKTTWSIQFVRGTATPSDWPTVCARRCRTSSNRKTMHLTSKNQFDSRKVKSMPCAINSKIPKLIKWGKPWARLSPSRENYTKVLAK